MRKFCHIRLLSQKLHQKQKLYLKLIDKMNIIKIKTFWLPGKDGRVEGP